MNHLVTNALGHRFIGARHKTTTFRGWPIALAAKVTRALALSGGAVYPDRIRLTVVSFDTRPKHAGGPALTTTGTFSVAAPDFHRLPDLLEAACLKRWLTTDPTARDLEPAAQEGRFCRATTNWFHGAVVCDIHAAGLDSQTVVLDLRAAIDWPRLFSDRQKTATLKRPPPKRSLDPTLCTPASLTSRAVARALAGPVRGREEGRLLPAPAG